MSLFSDADRLVNGFNCVSDSSQRGLKLSQPIGFSYFAAMFLSGNKLGKTGSCFVYFLFGFFHGKSAV